MNIAVRYHSRGGNTKQVAEAVAAALGVKAADCSVPLDSPVDLLFLGGAVYGGGLGKPLQEFISALSPATVGCTAVFGTSALKKEPEQAIVRQLAAQGLLVSPHKFHCWCAFTLLHRDHPNTADLKQAAAFAKAVLAQHKTA